MRKYTIPQSMSVEYFLGDHLGSTSLTTNADGGAGAAVQFGTAGGGAGGRIAVYSTYLNPAITRSVAGGLGYQPGGNGSTYSEGLPATPTPTPTAIPTLPPLPPFTRADFTYDADGNMVKSDMNGVITRYIGGHYQVTDGVATKYYFAGSSRVAMRTCTGGTCAAPTYLLSDHLGSTSITIDSNGNKSELRYNAWGEVRYAWSQNPGLPTDYTYTGQRSYMDDPTTAAAEGFGLLFYNARWYDPVIGRFAQADSVIPPGVQGLDRYAYANNNPLRYTDPSGHSTCQGQNWDDGPQCFKTLTSGGIKMKGLFHDLQNDHTWWWWETHDSFSTADFVTVTAYYELAGWNLNNKAAALWAEAFVRRFYDKYQTASDVNVFNYLGSYQSIRDRDNIAQFNPKVYLDTSDNLKQKSMPIDKAQNVSNQLFSPPSAWLHTGNNDPYSVGFYGKGNSTLAKDVVLNVNQFINANRGGIGPREVLFGVDNVDGSFSFILTKCQESTWEDDNHHIPGCTP